MPDDDKIRSIVAESYGRNDPIGWFETLYAGSNGATEEIPWADGKPNSHLVSWLDRQTIKGDDRRAVVVGCGLGDDAEELAKRGFNVTAFDVSSSAVDWAKRRFPDSRVRYRAADLLALPDELRGAFDFVFEAYTIQALPRSLRERAIEAVASLARPAGGEVLVVCRGREADEDEGTLPWPLSHQELALFESLGRARRVSFENFIEESRRAGEPPIRRFRSVFRRD